MPEAEGTATQVVPKDQETANIEAYARIFEKCLAIAERIGKATGRQTSESILKIAETLFSQFYHDQIEIKKQSQLVDFLNDMIRRRGM